jgi:hypothetical protein
MDRNKRTFTAVVPAVVPEAVIGLEGADPAAIGLVLRQAAGLSRAEVILRIGQRIAPRSAVEFFAAFVGREFQEHDVELIPEPSVTPEGFSFHRQAKAR